MLEKVKKFLLEKPKYWDKNFLIYDTILLIFDVFILKSKILLITGIIMITYDLYFYYQEKKGEKNERN